MVVLQLPGPPTPTAVTLLKLGAFHHNRAHPTVNLKRFETNPNSLTFRSKATLKPCFKTSNSIKRFTYLFPFVRSQCSSILKGWLCSLFSAYALYRFVPRVGQFSAILSRFDDVAQLRDEGFVLGILFLVRLISNYLQQAFLWDATLNSVYKIRMFVFAKVLERDLEFFEGGSSILGGDIAYRISAEARDVADAIYALLNVTVPTTLHLFAMTTQMLVISPLMSLISALVVPCMACVLAHLGGRLHMISKSAQVSSANISTYLNEVLLSIFFVKASSLELSEIARFERLAADDLSKCLKKRKVKLLIPQIVQIVYCGLLCMLCICSLVTCRGSISGSSLITFITSLVLVLEPILGVEKAYNEWRQAEPAIERLFDLTQFKSKVIEKQDATDLDCVTGELKFCDISFRYGDSMPLVLNGLDLHIAAGETVALVGPSGGGKTTLVKLLLRLYDPLHGRIFLDNHDIKSIRLESLRKHIGLVSQDIILFSGTVAENIGYGGVMGEIDMEKVEVAARNANADEFIRSLPQSYHTNIGPRGSMLSGGQKQRVAIARALYQHSSILILDEATSGLDSRSEVLVREAVARLMQNHTVVVIAHRLETVLMASRVLALKNGKLEELARASLLDSLAGTGFAF